MDRPVVQPNMEVLTADGIVIGKVERVDGDVLHLEQRASGSDTPAAIPLALVARVDRHVHLNVARDRLAAAAVQPQPSSRTESPPPMPGPAAAGGLAGTTAPRPHAASPSNDRARDELGGPLPPVSNPAIGGARARGNYYLPWVLGGLLLLVLLFALLRGCDTDDGRTSNTAAAPAIRDEGRDRAAGAYAPGTIAYDLDRFLASEEAAPRTFTFDRLNFDTRSAAIRQADVADLDQIAQVLGTYPAARIAVIGYTDARGSRRANADLGADRARSVVAALIARGVAENRLEGRSGGEQAPVARNARSEGRAENRRTELIALSR